MIICKPISRAKEASVEVAEKKELIGTLAKFQAALEKIDSYHHVILPPLYRQVLFALSKFSLLPISDSRL